MELTFSRNFRSLARPLSLLVFALAFVAGACAPGDDAGSESSGDEGTAELGERVENPSLGIAIAGVPQGFEVVTNEGDQLVLGRTGEGGGTLHFEATPIQSAGVNLQARVWEEKERIEAMPQGQYRGQNELGGVPLGTTYTSRGRFENEQGEMVEEYRALLVHPTQNRALILVYEYPVPKPTNEPGNPRLEDLMRVLEQVEPLGAGAAADSGEGAAEGAAANSGEGS